MSNSVADAIHHRTEQMRGWGWAHCLDLIVTGMAEDGATCEGENWPETAAALARCSDKVKGLADHVRCEIRQAEYRDRANGCE